jgi:PAS domain S-box-containing protein
MEQPIARDVWMILSGILTLLYGAGSVWLAVRWRRSGRLSALIVSVALGLGALARLYSGFRASDLSTVPFPNLGVVLDLLLLTFTIVMLVIAQRGDDGASLREAGWRLAESEDRFRLLFEHGGVGMALLSPDGDFLQVNPALLQMLGYPAEELLGRHISDIIHTDDRSSNFRLNDINGTSDYEREKRFLHRDGRIVWLRLMRVAVRDAHGAIRYHATVFIDVTQRKRTEEALAASEQRLRLRFQQAFDGISLWSASGTFLDANPALCRLLGLSREDLLGRNITEVAVDAEIFRRHLRCVLERAGDRCETLLYSRAGSAVDVEINSAILEVEGQRLILGMCRDISARKRAETALRHAESALREERDFITQILQTAEALIVVIDTDGRILRFNNKSQAVSGYTEEEVRGRPFWERLLPERDIEPVREHFRGLLAAPEETATRGFENPWLTKDGGERLIAWRISTMCDEQGRIRHVIAVGLDITDQRRLEDQVARSRHMETLGTLVGGIAHDFNNQLTAVLGNLDMVIKDLQRLRIADHSDCGLQIADCGLEEDSQSAIRNPQLETIEALLPCALDAERAAERCARMTARLLTFSRGRLGNVEPVALDQLLGETASALRHQLPPEMEVEVHAPPGTWPVTADVAQMQELLLNLAANARDAMPEGGVLTLSLANRTFTAADCAAHLESRPGSFVELVVHDTGCGMAAEVRERIFEPFFTTKKVGQGVGLGLSVVFGIVKGHKGWITVRSQPGEGSAFHIYLPAAESRAPETKPTPQLAPAQVPEGTILVVDDERLVRDLARTVLERWGFHVLTAEGGRAALDIYRRQRDTIDLILLDYTMPGMNGVQVLQELLRLDPNVSVVFSSGYSMDHDVNQLLAAGARAFVPKPYRPQDLVQTIRDTLTQYKPLMSEEI